MKLFIIVLFFIPVLSFAAGDAPLTEKSFHECATAFHNNASATSRSDKIIRASEILKTNKEKYLIKNSLDYVNRQLEKVKSKDAYSKLLEKSKEDLEIFPVFASVKHTFQFLNTYSSTLIISMLNFYSESLKFPTKKEISKIHNMSEADWQAYKKLTGIKNYEEFLQIITNEVTNFKSIQKDNVVTAYIQAVKESRDPESMMSQPSLNELLDSIKKQYPKATKTSLQAFLNKKKQAHSTIFIENGLTGLKELGKAKQPAMFRNFSDHGFLRELSDNAMKAIQKHDEFIVTSVTSGVPLDDTYFNLLLRFAEKHNAPIILMPVNTDVESLPKLLKDQDGFYKSSIQKPKKDDTEAEKDDNFINIYDIPNVHILNHTADITPFLKLWNVSLMARNFNPFASLDRAGHQNQTVIVAHPQYRLEIQSSDSNALHPTTLISTGSVSTKLYPSTTNKGKRLSDLSEARHDLSAVMFRKPNVKSSMIQEDILGIYHYQSLELQKLEDPKTNETEEGIILDGKFYGENGKDKNLTLEYLVLGDLHIGNTSQKMHNIIGQIVRDYPSLKSIVLHDFFDGSSINHHEKQNFMTQNYMQEINMSLYQEVRNVIQVLNALLHLKKDLEIVLVHSNHPEWLNKMLADPKAHGDFVDGSFMAEILTGMKFYNTKDPYEYLLKYRQDMFENNSRLLTKKRGEEHEIFISDPDRIRFLDKGNILYAGTKEDPIILHGHGHDFQGGRGGVTPSGMFKLPTAVIGHTHSPKKVGDVFNVGTATELQPGYTRGNLVSDWVHGFAFLFENTTKPILITIPPTVENYAHDPNGKVPSNKDFFGENYPKVYPNTNEILDPSAHITGASEKTRK